MVCNSCFSGMMLLTMMHNRGLMDFGSVMEDRCLVSCHVMSDSGLVVHRLNVLVDCGMCDDCFSVVSDWSLVVSCR